MADKEKQIEEMAEIIYEADVNNDTYTICFPLSMAECLNKYGAKRTNASIALYNAGYRKQSEGEWIKPSRYSEHICTICKKSPCQYFGMLPPFCPNCGAKMKGGEE